MFAAELDGFVPRGLCRIDQLLVGAGSRVQWNRQDVQALIALCLAMRRQPVVLHHPQHMPGVLLVLRERPYLAGDLRRGGVGNARHDRRDRATDGAALVTVIGVALRHQQAADIGETKAEGAVLVGQLGDFLRRELRHQDRDLEGQGPEAAGMLEGRDVEAAILVAELHQVQRRQVTGRIVEEHIFRARVGSVDPASLGAGVPLVDGGVVLQSRIGACPCGIGDLFPKVGRIDALGDAIVAALHQLPVALVEDGLKEFVADADRVVGVLAGHCEIGFGIPVGVICLELDLGIALTRELDHALDIVLRDHGAACGDDRLLQALVGARLEPVVAADSLVMAGGHDFAHMQLRELRAGNQCRHLLLLDDLPVDIGLDVRMVDIDCHHLRGAAGCATRLDGAGGAVADAKEAHQAGGTAAAGQALAFAADAAEVRAGARTVFEQARLADPQIHDAALVHQIVAYRLDEAGMRLRMLVGACRAGQLAGLVVDIVVALARPVDAIGPVHAGVEPLRRVRRGHLRGQHVAHLVIIGAGILLVGEIAALPAPVGPCAGETVEHLLGRILTAEPLFLGQLGECGLVGNRAPEPGRHSAFLDGLQLRRHAGFAEVFLRHDIGGDLRELYGNLDVLGAEHNSAVGVFNFAGCESELEGGVRVFACGRKASFKFHEMGL